MPQRSPLQAISFPSGPGPDFRGAWPQREYSQRIVLPQKSPKNLRGAATGAIVLKPSHLRWFPNERPQTRDPKKSRDM